MALLTALAAAALRLRHPWRPSRAWLFRLAMLFVAGPSLAAQTGGPTEYQVKAVFLFNFAQFVEWPADAFSSPTAPLVIGVLGDDPFGDFLDQTVRREHLGGRSFQVRRYQSVDDIKTCHILFISRPDADRPEDLLAGLKRRPLLTVSDADGFAQRGGMIRFVTDRGRIRIQLNLETAEAAHLTISSKLLRVAELVPPPGR